MTNGIKNAAALEEAIENLGKNKEEQKEELGDSMHNKLESLRPGNLIKSSVADLRSNGSLKKKITVGAVTTLSVFLLKKIWPKRWSGGLQMMIATAVITAIVQAALENKSKRMV